MKTQKPLKPVASLKAKLHPETIKHLKKGHPWITKDRYSEQFKKDPLLLIGQHGEQDICSFLNDPEHPTIKGRVWNLTPPFILYKRTFESEVRERLLASIQRRFMAQTHLKRDNFYIIFGEADLLPGLFVQKLGPHLLVQFYAFCWKKLERFLIKELCFIVDRLFGHPHSCWVQYRSTTQQKPAVLKHKTTRELPLIIEEASVKCHLHLGEGYDMGVYTDMAAIREQIFSLCQGKSRFLNLYAYTGLFSLMALSAKMSKVISVDISPKYLKWCEENVALNHELAQDNHQTLCMDSEEALKKLKNEKAFFDMIICDPPTQSSGVGIKQKHFDRFAHLLTACDKVLAPKGMIVLFSNDHTLSQKEFYSSVQKKAEQLSMKIIKKLSLTDDCPTLKPFLEGNYIKGVVLQKN